MSIEFFFLPFMSFLSLLVLGCGVVLLLRYVTYPYGDMCAFLELSGALKSFNRGECYYTAVGPGNNYMGEFEESYYNTNYNIFLNVLRLFPEKYRFRAAQFFNLAMYVLFVLGLFFLFYALTSRQGMSPDTARACSLLLALLHGARSKFLYMVLNPQAEVINFFFLVICALLSIYLLEKPSVPLALLWGGIVGLAYRNKASDIVLFISGLFFLAVHGVFFPFGLVVTGCFLAVNYELLFIVCRKKRHSTYLTDIWQKHLVIKKGEEKTVEVLRRVFVGFAKMLNLYSWESLWPSIGIALVFFPVSVLYLYVDHVLSKYFSYLLIYFLCNLLSGLFVTRKQVGPKDESYYFGCRQMYGLFTVVFIVNGVAFSIMLNRGESFYYLPYCFYLVFYLVHQAHNIMDYYFSDVLFETNVPLYKKEPEQYRIDLANFLRQVKEPMVVMGYYLKWGEIFGHLQGKKERRYLKVLRELDDDELVEIIRRYKVTHIAVTPLSGFIGERCSLRRNTLSEILAGKLTRNDITPQLTIYESKM